MAPAPSKDDLRILLVGKTGAGKSATGNSILGANKFPSKPSLSSTTERCMTGKSHQEGREITVLDTPGFFDTKGRAFTQANVQAWLQLLRPGPNAILLVSKLGIMKEEEKKSFQLAKELFRDGKHFLILLFTHKDYLDHDGITLEEFLEAADEDLKELMDAADNRCFAINNHAQGHEKAQQVAELIDMVDKLASNNSKSRSCYSIEMFEMNRKTEKLEKEVQDLKKEVQDLKKQKEDSNCILM